MGSLLTALLPTSSQSKLFVCFRYHPLGELNQDVKYKDVYTYLNCLQISPCTGWMNSNATLRDLTSEVSCYNEVDYYIFWKRLKISSNIRILNRRWATVSFLHYSIFCCWCRHQVNVYLFSSGTSSNNKPLVTKFRKALQDVIQVVQEVTEPRVASMLVLFLPWI